MKDKRILFQTEWLRLSSLPPIGTARDAHKTQKYIDFWKQYPYGKTGVYQLSLNKPKELVDKDIVYIGVSGTIHNRISNIRTCGGRGSSKSTHHNAGVYMRYNNITPDDVFVRILFVKKLKDAKSLEKELQQAHRTKFNYPQIGRAHV